MKLDSGEKLEIEANPDQKILVIWFLTKTIIYSIAAMFIIFTILLFVSAINTVSNQEKQSDVEVIESVDKMDEPNKEISGKNYHPFLIIIDYWERALVLMCMISMIIQVYLHFLRKTYRYIITDRRCIFVGGILKRIERTVPHKKITDVQRSQNIIERMLGIWNVQVFTPGTASVQIGQVKARAEINFDGLLNSEELYEEISRHTQLND